MTRKALYCIDTSALIAAWDERYPIDVFPQLWAGVAAIIEEGRLICPEEVAHELDKRSKDLAAWLLEAGPIMIPNDQDTVNHVARILASHERLVAERKRASSADPFVISLAKLRAAIVVTEEGQGTEAKPKIPTVCTAYRVECISLLDFIRAESWMMGGRKPPSRGGDQDDIFS